MLFGSVVNRSGKPLALRAAPGASVPVSVAWKARPRP
jgi:hypothetical protein